MTFRGFEFEDQAWFPHVIRNGMTDYLRFLFNTYNLYEPVLPLLKGGLLTTRDNTILDLCSGSGGAMEAIYINLKNTFDAHLQITLTDLFPNEEIYKQLQLKTGGGITYFSKPVDAADVPFELEGFRTIFSGFHHFNKIKAQEVLKNAVKSKQGIAIFDGGDKNIWIILLIVIAHPILLALLTPFFKPFKFSRIFFTYLLPVIPFCTVWDGIISIIRLYTPDELLGMAHESNNGNFKWIAGKVKNKFGMSIGYLIGVPL